MPLPLPSARQRKLGSKTPEFRPNRSVIYTDNAQRVFHSQTTRVFVLGLSLDVRLSLSRLSLVTVINDDNVLPRREPACDVDSMQVFVYSIVITTRQDGPTRGCFIT